MTLEPGDSTGVHTHEHEYYFHVLSGSVLDTINSERHSVGEFELPTGTHYLSLDGNELVLGDVRTPATHDAKNIGSDRYRETLVWLK